MGEDDPGYAVERGETTMVLLKTDTLPSVQEQAVVPTIRTIGRKNTLAVQMVSNSLTIPKKRAKYYAEKQKKSNWRFFAQESSLQIFETC